MFGLIDGERFAWGAVLGPVTIPEVIAFGVVLLGAFLVVERLQKEPVLPLRLFANRNLVIMAWLSGAMAFALFGMLLVVIVDLQSVLSMSPLQAGLTAAPLTISTTLVSPLAGRLSDRIGSRPVLIFGLTLAAAGVVDLALVEGPRSTSLTFLLPATIMGLGMGFVFAPLLTAALRDVPAELMGPAAGLLTTTRQVGSAIGTAAIGAILQNRLAAGLHQHAAELSDRLPAGLAAQFVEAATRTARSGLQVGPGQTRTPLLPAALAQFQGSEQLMREAFTGAYVEAMRPALAVVAAALLLGALTCLWIRRPARLSQVAGEPPQALTPRAALSGAEMNRSHKGV
jgi:MFS family permease